MGGGTQPITEQIQQLFKHRLGEKNQMAHAHTSTLKTVNATEKQWIHLTFLELKHKYRGKSSLYSHIILPHKVKYKLKIWCQNLQRKLRATLSVNKK